MNNTGIVILAAGESSRFGSIKQLKHFNGRTLLQHVIDEAVNSGAAPVVVVTGANADEVSSSITGSNVNIVFNNHWKQGMASGIVTGIQQINTLNRGLEKIIITVCDQPFVNAALLKQLDKIQQESGKHIVACAYADTIGTPVLFTRKYFEQLLGLKGDTGAKLIIKDHSEDVATVDFPQGAIDIDTQKDYENLLDEQKHVF
jgi:CTP:molybdopterin cytidylyltransferase MocA